MLASLITGFGRAGQDLHLPCLRKARHLSRAERLFRDMIGVVDPASRPAEGEGGLIYFPDLRQVNGFSPDSTVVHVCTPPGAHLAALCQAADLGYRRILAEKPLTTTQTDLDEVCRLQKERDLHLLVVANWLYSTLTVRLKDLIDSGRFGALRSISIAQHKPRFARTLRNSGHSSAFDVEMPHQVALALYLAGRPAQLQGAACRPLRVGDRVVNHMGAAQMALLHPSGVRSRLVSNLDAYRRERRMELIFERHRVVGHYPIDSDELYAGWAVYRHDGRCLTRETFEDDPLTSCFLHSYRYFAGRAECPDSDLSFNRDVVLTLCAAKAVTVSSPLDSRRGCRCPVP